MIVDCGLRKAAVGDLGDLGVSLCYESRVA